MKSVNLSRETPAGIWLIVLYLVLAWVSHVFAFFSDFSIIALLFAVFGFFALKDLIKLNFSGWKLSVIWLALLLLVSVLAIVAYFALMATYPDKFTISMLIPDFVFLFASLLALLYLLTQKNYFLGLKKEKIELKTKAFDFFKRKYFIISVTLAGILFLTFFGSVLFLPNYFALYLYAFNFSYPAYYATTFVLWSLIAAITLIAKYTKYLLLEGIALFLLFFTLLLPIGLIIINDPIDFAGVTLSKGYHPEFNIPFFTQPLSKSEAGWTVMWKTSQQGIEYEVEATKNQLTINTYGSKKEPTEQEFKEFMNSLVKHQSIKNFIENYEITGSGRGCTDYDDDKVWENIDDKNVGVKICQYEGKPFEAEVTIK